MIVDVKPYIKPNFILSLDLENLNYPKPSSLQIIQQMKTKGLIIQELDSHTATLVENQKLIYVYGGYINQSQLSASLFKFDFENNLLEEVEFNRESAVPKARCDHAIVFVENINSMILFGGKTGSLGERLNDLWMLSLDNLAWTEVERKDFGRSSWPLERSGHGMIINQDGQIYVFGGRGNDSVV